MLFVRRRFAGTSEPFGVVAVGDKDMVKDGIASQRRGGHRFHWREDTFSDNTEHVRTARNHNAQLSHDLFHQHCTLGSLHCQLEVAHSCLTHIILARPSARPLATAAG